MTGGGGAAVAGRATPCLRLETVDHEGAVLIRVADNGPGIPQDEHAMVFEKFYRCKASARQVSGTGLGLAISKSVVEKHGGKIWLESKAGKGAKFRQGGKSPDIHDRSNHVTWDSRSAPFQVLKDCLVKW